MAATIPQAFQDLFKKKAFASLATLMPDGSPQVTPADQTRVTATP